MSFITMLGFEPVYFLGDPKVFPYTMALTETWKEFGFGTIVYLATISGIDPTLYEAAEVDGAGRVAANGSHYAGGAAAHGRADADSQSGRRFEFEL